MYIIFKINEYCYGTITIVAFACQNQLLFKLEK